MSHPPTFLVRKISCHLNLTQKQNVPSNSLLDLGCSSLWYRLNRFMYILGHFQFCSVAHISLNFLLTCIYNRYFESSFKQAKVLYFVNFRILYPRIYTYVLVISPLSPDFLFQKMSL